LKKIFLWVLASVAFCGYAQNVDNRIVIGNTDSIYSKILNEERKIWVHMPDTSGNGLYSKKKYPVVFLLDGDQFFYATVGTLQFLSEANRVCPEMILVGITNTDRMRDLTPWHDTTVPKDSDLVRSSGGGERFTAFLEKELIPYIEANYPTAPYRMLIGHSLGGLLVLNTLINHTEMFNSYVAIDPATYWADQALLKQAATAPRQKKMANKSLYIGLSGSLPTNVDSTMMDKSLSTVSERSDIEFDRLVNFSSSSGLRYYHKYYDNETHNAVAFPAIYDALHFMFDFMALPKINRDTVTTAFYIGHYKMVSQKMDYEVLPPEDLINGMGYYFLNKKCLRKRIVSFR